MQSMQMPTNLNQILTRLRAMVNSSDSSVQVRRFEAYGVEVLQVTYDQTTALWEVKEHRQIRVFEFDDIDLVAIEVYDLLHDMQLVF